MENPGALLDAGIGPIVSQYILSSRFIYSHYSFLLDLWPFRCLGVQVVNYFEYHPFAWGIARKTEIFQEGRLREEIMVWCTTIDTANLMLDSLELEPKTEILVKVI